MASETGWAAGVSDAVAGAVRGYVRYAPGTLGKGMLAARYLNPYLREHPRELQVRAYLDTTFVVDSRDLIQRYIGLFGTWEPHLTAWLRRRLRPGDGFIDVGANIGYFAVVASRLVGPQGRVVAVEASPRFHEKILRHIDLNNSTNVRAVNAAVSDKNESLTFVLASSNNLGATSIVPYDGRAEATFTAQAQPLPELLEPAEIAQARVIKIDVEGAEGRVVRGLAPVLDQLRPDAEIVVGVEPDRMRLLGDDVAELLTAMGDHGFHAYRLPTDYRPESYLHALRKPQPPIRLHEAIVGETELVFSRIDTEILL